MHTPRTQGSAQWFRNGIFIDKSADMKMAIHTPQWASGASKKDSH
jgi:hypothetical protein